MTHIAVIDDEPLVGKSFARLLTFQGYETSYFDSAEAYLAADPICSADCLVVDYRLPGINGCELVRNLRAESIDIPAVIVSGNVDDAPVPLLRGLTHVETLGKPCLPNVLYMSIERVLASAELTRRNTG